MKNKKVLTIVILLAGIILIIAGVVVSTNLSDSETPNTEKNPNENSSGTDLDGDSDGPIDDVHPESSYTYESVKSMAESLYGGEGKNVEVTDNGNEFIITVKNISTGQTINTFSMDKETGVISEKPIETISNSSSS